MEREDQLRREELEYEQEQEEERCHRKEYREKYGHNNEEEEHYYEPPGVSSNFQNTNERAKSVTSVNDAKLIDGNPHKSNTNVNKNLDERNQNVRPHQNLSFPPPFDQTKENLNQPRVENIGLLERDSTKLEYYLTQYKNKMWRSICDMGLGLKRLSDVVDENAPPPRAYTQIEMNERRKIVRGIIISHVDESYQEQIIELENPKEMLDKIYKMKREEINDTTVSVKDQLHNLKFQMGVDTVFNFNSEFDDLPLRHRDVSSVVTAGTTAPPSIDAKASLNAIAVKDLGTRAFSAQITVRLGTVNAPTSEQQEKKVMPVQNQANLVVPPPAAPIPLPPPPIPMPFWFMPPQPPMFNFNPNVNCSTIEDGINRIRKEEERQRENYDVTTTKCNFHRGRGRGSMLRV
ncbi:hypothetical protein V9T40_008578 [Parthenolecanium corni]|uniref:Uncharacterized protein n=1 Tax=Parthenolecanium corni TaxID=536013 RepID=A0AAN9TNT5_9HEMI